VSNLQEAQQTLKVRKMITEKRSAALLGGGQKRIDSQHAKERSDTMNRSWTDLAFFWGTHGCENVGQKTNKQAHKNKNKKTRQKQS
jgi:hypothetical protein